MKQRYESIVRIAYEHEARISVPHLRAQQLSDVFRSGMLENVLVVRAQATVLVAQVGVQNRIAVFLQRLFDARRPGFVESQKNELFLV